MIIYYAQLRGYSTIRPSFFLGGGGLVCRPFHACTKFGPLCVKPNFSFVCMYASAGKFDISETRLTHYMIGCIDGWIHS